MGGTTLAGNSSEEPRDSPDTLGSVTQAAEPVPSLGQVMSHPGVLYQVSKLVQVQGGGPCACRRHIQDPQPVRDRSRRFLNIFSNNVRAESDQ
jgi:hypothetical protein